MRAAAAVFAASLALAASAAGVAAETIEITIKGLKFTPAEVTAHVGDTIAWINEDIVAHTATGTSKEFDVRIARGETGSVVLEGVGTVDYFCRLHPNMKARITIVP